VQSLRFYSLQGLVLDTFCDSLEIPTQRGSKSCVPVSLRINISRVVFFLLALVNSSIFTLSFEFIMSGDKAIIGGVWTGNRIYWTLIHANRDYSLQITITQRLVFSVTLFGSGFQQMTFLCSGLTSPQAGGHLTPNSYSPNCRIKTAP
jgi:hypothetical protein